MAVEKAVSVCQHWCQQAALTAGASGPRKLKVLFGGTAEDPGFPQDSWSPSQVCPGLIPPSLSLSGSLHTG